MNILFIIKVNTHVLTKWSYSAPPIMLNIEHVVQSLIKYFFWVCLFLNPHLSAYHLNIGVHILAMLE